MATLLQWWSYKTLFRMTQSQPSRYCRGQEHINLTKNLYYMHEVDLWFPISRNLIGSSWNDKKTWEREKCSVNLVRPVETLRYWILIYPNLHMWKYEPTLVLLSARVYLNDRDNKYLTQKIQFNGYIYDIMHSNYIEEF